MINEIKWLLSLFQLSSPEQCESALPSADWWSVGVILFELATGSFLSEAYPSGLQLHTPVAVPDAVHPHLASLVAALLRVSQDDRLGGRDVTTHPFFDGMQWSLDDA
jgi:serine/threonine protein kinase